MTFDVCVIGHVTQDRIERSGRPPEIQPGGAAYYAGVTARRLGLRTAVVTRLRPADRADLLGGLDALGVAIHCLPSPATTTFVNRYAGPDLDARQQQVTAVAAPFRPEDFTFDARWYLCGPLTRDELPAPCVHHLAQRGGRIALDLQGLLRDVRDGHVVPAPNEALDDYLSCVDVLKASFEEARLATGAPTAEAAARMLGAAGPREVIVTSGSRGSHLCAGWRVVAVPAYPPPAVVDTTGCGDTYLAAYVARRLAGDPVEQAGHFAAAAASAKIARHGAFSGTSAVVNDLRGLPRRTA